MVTLASPCAHCHGRVMKLIVGVDLFAWVGAQSYLEAVSLFCCTTVLYWSLCLCVCAHACMCALSTV